MSAASSCCRRRLDKTRSMEGSAKQVSTQCKHHLDPPSHPIIHPACHSSCGAQGAPFECVRFHKSPPRARCRRLGRFRAGLDPPQLAQRLAACRRRLHQLCHLGMQQVECAMCVRCAMSNPSRALCFEAVSSHTLEPPPHHVPAVCFPPSSRASPRPLPLLRPARQRASPRAPPAPPPPPTAASPRPPPPRAAPRRRPAPTPRTPDSPDDPWSDRSGGGDNGGGGGDGDDSGQNCSAKRRKKRHKERLSMRRHSALPSCLHLAPRPCWRARSRVPPRAPPPPAAARGRSRGPLCCSPQPPRTLTDKKWRLEKDLLPTSRQWG